MRLTHRLSRQGNLDPGDQGNLAPVVKVGLHGPHGVEQGSLHLRLPSQHQKMHLVNKFWSTGKMQKLWTKNPMTDQGDNIFRVKENLLRFVEVVHDGRVLLLLT